MSVAAPAQTAPTSSDRAAGSSFYTAMKILPPAQREAMFEIYSFCRRVDDVADSSAPRAERLMELAAWRADINALYDGKPPPRVAGLAKPVADFDLAREDFLALVDGMEMDAFNDIRGPSAAILDMYCDRVASAVGRLSVRVFGIERGAGIALAHHLGRALQLTNILRDLDEDAGRGRLYLPRQILEPHGIGATDPEAALRHPALPAACRDLAAIAAAYFAASQRAMARCRRRAMRPAAVMGAVYEATLAELVRRDWRDPAARVSLSKSRKLWLALRHGLV